MVKKKIVIDTNNMISALGWNGKSRLLMQKVLDGEFALFVSAKQVAELKRVMDYPRLCFNEEQKSGFLKILFQAARIINTKITLHVFDDADDNMLLECAVESDAEYVISGDKDVLRFRDYKGIRLVSVDEFLKKNL